ncbi:antibiotic biosynthesis monooxygenase [Streptomyces sp. NPDC048623]|uniref:antibiotic biosynthesis monooxygenase family protein n=1 Tax=Streptomyces sp. NPDC048623 TaxID=3155761 RepID=UPI003445FF4B
MPVIVTVEIPGGTQEQYERMTEQITSAPWFPMPGFLAHAGGPDGTGGWRVVDFWESEAAFRAFVEKAMPIFHENGAQVMPKVDEAVKVIVNP